MNFKELYNKHNKNIFYFIAFLIIFIGIYIRADLYFKEFPLWQDELTLAVNIVNFDLINIFAPLKEILNLPQISPPLFALSNYILFIIFGFKATVFRFIPFISSIFIIILMFLLAKELYNKRLPIIISLVLISISAPLIYYSNEFKTYESDVMFCLLLIFLYKYIDLKVFSIKKFILYALITFIITLFSFPAFIFITAILLVKILEYKKITKMFAAVFLSLLLSFLLIINSFLYYEGNTYLKLFWQSGFLNFSFQSIKLIINSFSNFINFRTIPAIILCSIGAITFLQKKNKQGLLMIFIILITCILSILKVYPMLERTILFFIPIIIFLIAKSLDLSFEKKYMNILYKSLLIIVFALLINKIDYMFPKVNYDNLVNKNSIIFHKEKIYSFRETEKQIYINFLNNYKNLPPTIATERFSLYQFIYKPMSNNVLFSYSKNNINCLLKKYNNSQYKLVIFGDIYIEDYLNNNKIPYKKIELNSHFNILVIKNLQFLLK